MNYEIEYRKSIFRSGTNLIVCLYFTETEHRIIRDHNMEPITIVELEPIRELIENEDGKRETVEVDQNIYFKDLYGRRTSWHCKSVMEAQDFHKKLSKGLLQFAANLATNYRPSKKTT